MKLSEVKEILKADVLCCSELLDSEVNSACGADLMSDVLAFSVDKSLLLTGLINPQTIRTAEMMDMRAIVYVRGKTPAPEVIELAKSREMIVLKTKYPMFEACGRLYENGLK